MKSYFPDINVWIALSYEAHVHHLPAKQWFDGITGSAAYFCRFTQLGFLRLLTHPSVMRDALKSQQQAWRAYDLLNHDQRVLFLAEPDTEALDPVFRKFTAGDRPHTKQWPDAYLAAFARATELVLVTFDRSLGRLVTPNVLLLG
jgi:toxin-antitoxin system PIN domain toxin